MKIVCVDDVVLPIIVRFTVSDVNFSVSTRFLSKGIRKDYSSTLDSMLGIGTYGQGLFYTRYLINTPKLSL